MSRYPLVLFLLLAGGAHGQSDTTHLKFIYDQCLDFDESKTDSLCYYAGFIEKESQKIGFKKGRVLSLRLKGLCEEFKYEYENAIDYYLQSLEEARQLKEVAYEIAALSDLAIAYANIGRPLQAKSFYQECAALALKTNEIYTVVTSYNNLGVIYTQLGQYDSALIFLNEGLRLGKEGDGHIDPSSTYNNIGNAWFKKKQFNLAEEYFQMNYRKHLNEPEDIVPLWTDHINLADVYIELKKFDSALFHANQALNLASNTLKAKRKEADSYSILAKLYERKGAYEKAYQYLIKWHDLDTSLVNGDTQNKIAELQERFNAKERDAQNKLLLEQMEKERYRNRSVTYLAIALGIIGLLVAIAFIIKRNANRRLTINNEMIKRQNQRLEELNYEKNSLIGIVSHDLATPFATIQMWGQLLQTDQQTFNADQQKAVNRIIQAGEHGQQLIQRILDVEKADIGSYKLNLEHFDITVFIESLTESLRPAAGNKSIQLHSDTPGKSVYVLSDKQLVHRIVENLVSNAIKFSPRGRNVWVAISEEGDRVHIKVRDEGQGIEKDELPLLFSKYSKLSSKPTAGEPSTGLGLSIVKRIVEELNGKIFCESEAGKGSLFTVILKK